MRVMERLTTCRECGANVFASDVFKTIAIPKAPNYYALIYKCSNCGEADKVSSLIEEWEDIKERSDIVEEKNKTVIKMGELMLDQDIDIEYLRAYWSAQRTPPPIERGKSEKKR